MPSLTRRSMLFSCAALPWVLCRPGAAGAATVASVRMPAIGQYWNYRLRDGYTGADLGPQSDSIVSVEPAIIIATGRTADLPARREIQTAWGMVRIDPHWDQIQEYRAPVPLWPTELRPGWSTVVNTSYATAAADGLAWQLIMKAHAWELITVPAGSFKALRVTNWINYFHSADASTNAVREESLWLVPEVGRWVARESRGHWYDDASGYGQPIQESSRRWELTDWA